MATNLAYQRMSATEFLTWDDGTDTVYELVDGAPVAMAPAGTRHGRIAQNVGTVIDRAVAARPPCRSIQRAGVIAIEGPPGKVFVPDVILTCEPDTNQPTATEPTLIVEVLLPGTRQYDERHKVPAYGELPTVVEIWLIDSEARWMLIWQRLEGTWQAGLPLIGRASFHSAALGAPVSLDEIYRLTSLAADEPGGATDAAP